MMAIAEPFLSFSVEFTQEGQNLLILLQADAISFVSDHEDLESVLIIVRFPSYSQNCSHFTRSFGHFHLENDQWD
jgi:hypothetical protein